VGTIVVFPVGPENGECLRTEFYPEVDRHDLIAQDKYHIYLKLAIDGKQSQPFSANTLSPFGDYTPQRNKVIIIKLSRKKYSERKSNPKEAVSQRLPLW
jgi:hypothetical protein